MLRTFVYKFLFEYLFLILFSICLTYCGSCLFNLRSAKPLSTVAAPFYCPTRSAQGSGSPYCHQHLLFALFFNYNHPAGYEVEACAFNLHFHNCVLTILYRLWENDWWWSYMGFCFVLCLFWVTDLFENLENAIESFSRKTAYSNVVTPSSACAFRMFSRI